tara:strand:- start:34 stop:393 length:360 start_codon:yes stop_codon:yes gene_type:complete
MHGQSHDSTKQHGGALAPHHPKAKKENEMARKKSLKTLLAQKKKLDEQLKAIPAWDELKGIEKEIDKIMGPYREQAKSDFKESGIKKSPDGGVMIDNVPFKYSAYTQSFTTARFTRLDV